MSDRITKQDNMLHMFGSEGVLAQESMGTRQMVASQQLPKDVDTDALLAIGIQFIGPSKGDDLFIDVKLPDGWTRCRSTEDSRTSYVCDAVGNKRVRVWYKAASYDRKAYATVLRRFGVQARGFNEYTCGVCWVLDEKDPSAPVSVFQTEDMKFATSKEYFAADDAGAIKAPCLLWLSDNYPDWRSPAAYWDIEVARTGEFPEWGVRTR